MSNKVEFGNLFLRFVVGVTFFLHGLAKFQSGLDNIAGWFQSIGLPGFMAYGIAGIELIGGFLLIIGLGTRYLSWIFVLIMAGAIVKVKLANGFLGNGQMPGYELDVILLATSAYLGLNGSRFLAVDGLFQKSASEVKIGK